jgi:arsenate reductase
VRPGAIQAMSEIGIDISNRRSKSVEGFIDRQFDYVITVCNNAKESRPVFPGNAARINQSFDDPPPPGVGDDEFRLAVFRRVRDEIRQWMEGFIKAPGK